MNIGNTRNSVQFCVRVTEKGATWRNFPRHLETSKFSAFVEAFRQILAVDAKGKTVVSNILSLVGIYAVAAGYNISKDVQVNPYLKAVIDEIGTYWDYSGSDTYKALYRVKVKTAFIALLNKVDNGYQYKTVSGKAIDNIIRGKLVSINNQSGNARDTRPSERQIIKQICLEIYNITAYKTEKRYAPIEEK